jgi:type VI secretion system protein ImpK
MSSLPASAALSPRTNNLALAFQEVFTVVLRTRSNVQRWESAADMRAGVKRMTATATHTVRALGYSNETAQMAMHAVAGFLDESVLSSRDPVFADWARQTLQEELFGDNLEGERFFRRVAELLNQPRSSEVADILELHCLCLLLGFRGRYAFGDASEIHTIVRRIREAIASVRGPFVLVRQAASPAVPEQPARDRWVRNLGMAAIVLGIVCLAAYLGFRLFLLSQSADIRSQVTPIGGHRPFAAVSDRQRELSL